MMTIGFLDLENMGVDINFTKLDPSVTKLNENCDLPVMAAIN